MSRVDDAMRKAGQSADEGAAGSEDNAQFVAAETTNDAPVVLDGAVEDDDRPRTDSQPTREAGPLVLAGRAVPLPAGISPPDGEIQLLDLMQALRRRRWTIAAVIALSIGAAAIYTTMATRIYEARARLLIEAGSSQIVPFRPVVDETQATFDYLQTQIEVLRSRALARRALERLHLLRDDPDSQAAQVGFVAGSLRVAAVSQSRVVTLSFRSSDPEYAARMANGLAETYVDQNVEVRRQGSREAAKWLNERLEELQQQVNRSQDALQNYREQKDSVSLEDRQNIVVQKLTQLNTAVTTARTDRVARQTMYEQLRALQESGAPLDTFPSILSNPFIQTLKSELGGLQRERAQLSERLGDLHPDMVKVTTQIEATEQRLKAEVGKMVEALRNDFTTAQASERGLMAALEAQKHEVLDLNQKSIGYGALQRNAASIQQVFEGVMQRLKETELSGELQANNARILDAAEVPQFPVSPQTLLILVVALLAGSVVGVGLALGLEYLNPRIARPDEIGDALGLPLLGVAPMTATVQAGLSGLVALPVQFHEALRDIRTRILLAPVAGGVRTLAVTSAIAGEGKTVVASGLAMSLANTGRRVLLVDGDMRRSRLHDIFNIPRGPGLSEVLAGEAKPSAVLRKSSVKGLFLLPAGLAVASPSDLLDSSQLTQLIEGFSQVFDLVVIDCPPVMAVTDASLIANASSTVLFVVGAGLTSRDAAKVAVDRLAAVKARVLGVVLNRAKLDSTDVQYAGYGDYYADEAGPTVTYG